MLKRIKKAELEELQSGKSAITLEDIRWKYSHIKSISLLPSVLLYEKVRLAKCDEGILVRDGFAIEGISSNLFVVRNGIVITPPISINSLSGTTRAFVLQVLSKNLIVFSEEAIAEKDLEHADEVWISSSTRGIFPIVKLNDKLIGDGLPGLLWKKAIKLFMDTQGKQQ